MSAQSNGIGIPHRPPVTQRPPKKESTFGKRSKGLRRSKSKRPLSPQAMDDLVTEVMLRDGRCVAIDHTETMCDGRTEAHHIVPQRVLKAHYEPGHPVYSDTANVVALCSRHHNNVERGLLHLPDEALPWNFRLFLMHRGFVDWWDAEIARRT